MTIIGAGSLYHVADILDQSPANDDEWFSETTTVNGDTIVVKVNEKQVVDWMQTADWNGGREGPGHPELIRSCRGDGPIDEIERAIRLAATGCP